MKRKLTAGILALLFILAMPLSAYADDDVPPILPVSIDTLNITLNSTSYTYCGIAYTPKVTVMDGETTLVKDTDYTLEYINNINTGTAKVVITAAATSTAYTGSATKEFTINQKTLSSMKTKEISTTNYYYSGSERTPSIKIFSDELALKKNVDFTVKYTNNVNTGRATLTATGIGNFKGTVTKYFYIYPKKITSISVSSIKTSSYKLTWNKISGNISGYKIYKYNESSKTYKYYKSTSKNYLSVTKQASGKRYYYKVKAYKNVSGTSKVLYSNTSISRRAITVPAKVTTQNSNFSGKYYKVQWKVISSDGYQVRYSTDSKLAKGVTTKTLNGYSKNTYKFKINKGKTYYYKVRAFKVSATGKTYYGEWSTKKSTYFSNVFSTYDTWFYSPAGRITNIKLASKYIDGTVLQPGDTFSFNGVVGRRTPERGFQLAHVFNESGVGYGGGVCQVSSTIFNAALLANLQIVERWQHTLTVSYVPRGRDAAISWGTNNMRFKNNTKYEIKISCKVYNSNHIVVKLLTNTAASHKKVSISVSSSYYGSGTYTYVMKRYAGGKCNYTTYSTY